MNIIQDASWNRTNGRENKTIDTIELHSTYGTYWGSVSWMKNTSSKVSAHYIISTDGEIRQLVPEKDTAWHSGNWDMNLRSIAIETTDNKSKDIAPKAKEALIWLVADIRRRNASIKSIKYHREVVATACPFLNIDKAWFTQADPLQECLRLHGALVKENTQLKADIAAVKQSLQTQKDEIKKKIISLVNSI